jgi:Ca2+ transporting ATPase
LRTICIAYKDLREGEGGINHDDEADDGFMHIIEKENLTCIAILGIKDIIRPEVPDAVAQCKLAGVRVRMVTGDNKVTAQAIAKECGIITEDLEVKEYTILEGKEFYDLVEGMACRNCHKNCPCACPADKINERVVNTDKFEQIRDQLCVLARSRPEDKYLLVTGLRQYGDVVAVTGDGTNDAPALKKADVGFAMGITGTDVAKGAADIILLDDNFASIVQACMWGRNIYDNIRRFLQF